MVTVKILGAGSIGNHMAHAARAQGWQVRLCDVDDAALERTRSHIYPQRYGEWDDAIELYSLHDAPKSRHDLIVIGTPPHTHLELALEALAEKPGAILVEKPLCTPGLDGMDEFEHASTRHGVRVFVGYNHAVGKAVRRADELVGKIGEPQALDVEFREHWGGIFAAHPWLSGPGDSYLGHWKRGGGASGEHSHAIHLWQHLARRAGAGRVVEVTATLDYVQDEGAEYDRLCLLNLRTEGGLLGRVVQDVVTSPPRKWARLQGRDAHVELAIGLPEGADSVSSGRNGEPAQTLHIPKTRPDDFTAELEQVAAALGTESGAEAIGLERGVEAMLVIAAAHRSAQTHRPVRIDYTAGRTRDALRPL